MRKKKWEALSSRGLPPGTGATARGRWVVCFNCRGHGREIEYIGKPHCDWCNGTGKRWEVRIRASTITKEDWLAKCDGMAKE